MCLGFPLRIGGGANRSHLLQKRDWICLQSLRQKGADIHLESLPKADYTQQKDYDQFSNQILLPNSGGMHIATAGIFERVVLVLVCMFKG